MTTSDELYRQAVTRVLTAPAEWLAEVEQVVEPVVEPVVVDITAAALEPEEAVAS